MPNLDNNNTFVFIVGSPRSGTTILGKILNSHKIISQWYEPYFIWDHYFRNHPHDERIKKEATPQISHQIYNAFLKYKKKTGSKIIVDKSPRNSLKIPFILDIFPNARFIHIIRDGRDATLSIHKEWIRRKKIVSNSNQRFDYLTAIIGIKSWLQRQPFFLDKIRALWFETHFHFINKSKHLNRLRWKMDVGWGPRFSNWEEILNKNSLFQFSAYQWSACVKSIMKYWPEIPDKNKIKIRYEDLLREENIIKEILDFLEVQIDTDFLSSMPALKRNNYNKWQKELSKEQANEIAHILTPMLIKLGYETNYDWPKRTASKD